MQLKLKDIRYIALLLLVFVVIFISSQNNDFVFNNIYESKHFSNEDISKPSEDDTFEDVIEKYLTARESGMTQDDIAKEVFNFVFPNQK